MVNEYLSTWNLIRLSGFLSYFLLTISLVFGFLQAFAGLKKRKGEFLLVHQNSGWLGLLVIVFHMLMLFWDQYIEYPLLSILIPFSAENEPFYSGLGTISFYLFLIIIGSSDFFMKKLGRTVWKKVHLLAIPAWLLMAIHGIMIGTDSQEGWAKLIYIVSIAVILILGIAKGMEVGTGAGATVKAVTKKTQV
ncbi:iron reductase [Bacillus sp. DNRA2]|uniref:ferric reductase-like transmembrane domain-containing protein n=1 Tax=Bacillus sp. DNRA2 TaxID=2723053 RepID=UPI00145E6270|nr:ferric reductase-like transmembrane domain-containing protein [Bacillus sp. DNRA2]NMD71412.1 iron reductase [Bacillus sp. DNRA2]